ncbi:uncharacterized protein BO95DRAFT_86990 [Aspergillus brunneoviolaceus CBS 621.78]|uniref:Uncharacterized protein n=1 Tax=Aspergillus brunneoviolaceus CBS 621.78 TaxID=1450534 RepID=A0ACD1GDE8_9EURO|nr:hypothetical protein BO95DRAFT_86990 [Aspergillus brunneoviolaceus CBS 621.78]RAH47237.1 hypothetical protein BO95DRAFT_86990 [Aspergillus brunneoviolaceus CBS 621.78]
MTRHLGTMTKCHCTASSVASRPPSNLRSSDWIRVARCRKPPRRRPGQSNPVSSFCPAEVSHLSPCPCPASTKARPGVSVPKEVDGLSSSGIEGYAMRARRDIHCILLF